MRLEMKKSNYQIGKSQVLSLLACLFLSPVTSFNGMDLLESLFCGERTCDSLEHGLMVLSFARMPFFQSGVSQGEGKAAAPRCSQQGSDALHCHPPALVPSLFVKAALLAKEGCSLFNTGNIYRRQLKITTDVLKEVSHLPETPYSFQCFANIVCF